MINAVMVFLILSSFLFIYPLAGNSNEISAIVEHQKTILEEIRQNPSLSTLAKIISNTYLVDVLESEGPFTLFAPSNEAFAKLAPGTLDDWLKPNNKEILTKILEYHIALGKITLEDLKKNSGLMTLSGQHVSIKTDNNNMTVNNVDLTKSNFEYSNGIVYIIDQVLVPKMTVK
jgi:uncharacterized surface protein with fasciclin (FAS1) repeats